MKYVKNILFLLVVYLSFISFVFADEKNLVNIYLFYSDTCPHCESEQKLLNELKNKYDNIRIYKYEVGNDENSKLLENIAMLFDTRVTGVPFTVVGDKVYKGFNYENSKAKFMATIEYYSDNGYKDLVGEYIGNIELPSYEVVIDSGDEELSEYIEYYGNHVISILGMNIETKNLALPLVSILIGLVDGFNPCAMWVLLFLISMLIGMKNKKRMWSLGLTFLLTSALIYLLFMISWLNVATFLTSISIVRLLIGGIAIGGALFNLYGYFKNRKTEGCMVVNDKKRNKIFDRIKKFTHEKNFFLAIIGVIALTVSVNIVELACSLGFPAIFSEILALNNVTGILRIIYLLIYVIFYMLDDFIVFTIAICTLSISTKSTKYTKYVNLIAGIIMILIGTLLIFKPEWVMLNF